MPSFLDEKSLINWAVEILLAGNSMKIEFNTQFARENFLSEKVAPENRSLQKKIHFFWYLIK